MSNLTNLAGKVFVLSLPSKEENKDYCKLLKDDEKFMSKVLEIEGCMEVEGPNITGCFAITFDVFDCPYSDNEIIEMIDTITNNIGFTD